MKDATPISQESLNAFLDGELTADERSQILAVIQQDKQLAQELCELRQTKELLALAYQEPPLLPTQTSARSSTAQQRIRRSLAATVLLGIGLGSGWFAHHNLAGDTQPSFQNIAHLDLTTADNSKILLHISTMDASRVAIALDTTEKLLNDPQREKKPFQLEIVANAEGLGLFREGSPYAKRIHDIALQHGNVSFKACGFAMENLRLKEGSEVKLILEAQRVDAALEQILRRLKDGWMYVRA